jgi:predicted ATPase
MLKVERVPAPGPDMARPAGDGLPVNPTPLIGRRRELAELGQRLADPACRLLTLVGPGGIGKTRLAIRAAREFGHLFADGVAFVPLAPLTSGYFIIPAIAQALDFSFSGPAEPQTQLGHYLRDKHPLLVLDNAEYRLLDGAAELLAEMHVWAPRGTLLATSRETLNVQDDWLFEVSAPPAPPAWY